MWELAIIIIQTCACHRDVSRDRTRTTDRPTPRQIQCGGGQMGMCRSRLNCFVNLNNSPVSRALYLHFQQAFCCPHCLLRSVVLRLLSNLFYLSFQNEHQKCRSLCIHPASSSLAMLLCNYSWWRGPTTTRPRLSFSLSVPPLHITVHTQVVDISGGPLLTTPLHKDILSRRRVMPIAP